ncbi:U3 snoRNP protein [Lunasporangiospora selenospora]|uniref:U3 snoRNP protein n=1 Tax=Lunasporangiospora selenospora TaxID=979761 RepID=A0A9P6FZW5_9FUNG|nr:U3 snoRNP protein [Lunasporangiospora selenospora]
MLENTMESDAIAKQLNEGQGANRYRYQSFSARVSQLKIKITRQVGLKESTTVSNGSFFNDAFEEWKELNLSAPFVMFGLEARNYCQTLPQLLYHKEKVVDLLIKNLEEANVLSLEPILDLTTQLSRDLDQELFPYVDRLLTAVLPLAKMRDVKVIEWTFNCIASLFKTYSEQLRKDLRPTFRLIAPLLGEDNSQKPYIRNFAAESFSFLMRKAPVEHLKVILDYIFSLLHSTPTEAFVEGVAKLLFETIKLVGNQFQHRGIDVVLRGAIQVLKKEDDVEVTEKGMSDNTTFRTLCKTLVLMNHYSTREHFKGVIEMLLDELVLAMEQPTPKKKDQKRWLNISEMLALINVCVSVRKGSRINDFAAIYDKVVKVSNLALGSDSKAPTLIIQETMKLSSVLFTFSPLENILFPGGQLLESIYKHEDVSTVLAFSISLINLKWSHYTQILLPHIVKYCSAHWKAEVANQIIVFLATLLTSERLELTPGMVAATVDENGLLKFPASRAAPSKKKGTKTSQEGPERIVDGILNIISTTCDWKSEADMLGDYQLEEDSAEVPRIALATAALSIVPHISSPFGPTTDAILKLLQSLLKALAKEDQSITLQKRPFVQGSAMATLHILVGETIEILSTVCERAGSEGSSVLAKHWDLVILDALGNYGSNEVVLRGVAKYCNVLKDSNTANELFSADTVRILYPKLERNINSLQHRRRLHTLEILSTFDVVPHVDQDPKQRVVAQDNIFAQCLAIESISVTVHTFRDKTMQIRKLNTIISSGQVNDFYKTVAMRLCLGILTINFKPLWADATVLLVKSAELYPEAFWELLFGEIMRFENEELLVESGLSAQAIEDYQTIQTRFHSNPVSTDGKKKEIQFECPTLKMVRRVNATSFELSKPTRSGWALVLHFITTYAPGSDRLDYWNYYGLLLKALSELVQVFLNFIKVEYEPAWERKDDKDIDMEMDEEEDDSEENLKILPKTTKTTKDRLHQFLSLFSKFKNPKQAFESNTLYNLYLHFLTIGDAPLQTLALNCVFTFKSPSVTPYQDNLKNILDDVKFRDELSTFIIAEGETSSIGALHREELMPIVIRLLYGCMISRKGRASARAGMAARRKAVLNALGGCNTQEHGFFVNLLIDSFVLGDAGVTNGQFAFVPLMNGSERQPIGPLRKQLGFLSLLEDVLKVLGSTIAPFLSKILTAIMAMVNQAQERLDLAMDDQMMHSAEEGFGESVESKQLKDVRHSGIKRITKIFGLPIVSFDFAPYVPAMFKSFLDRRVEKLASESTQAPSAIMELFAAWALRKDYALFLVQHNKQVMDGIYDCLSAKKVRDSVVSMVLGMCEDILGHCYLEKDQPEKPLTEQILVPYTDRLLDNLEIVLEKGHDGVRFGKDQFSKREISILSHVAAHVKNGTQAVKLIDLLLPSLKKHHKAVPERTKADILQIIVDFMPIIPDMGPQSPLFVRYYNSLVILFSTLMPETAAHLSTLVADMNSFSKARMDMPDFDRRMDAFNLLTDSLYLNLNDRQWLPVLHNLMFSIRDREEMSIRSNSSFGFQRFIDRCADIPESDPQHELFRGLLVHVVFAGLKKGFKAPVELVRFEFVSVLAHAIKRCPEQPQFSDMVSLLAGGDEEASFFTNIYHIQLHRRIRALNRFSEECAKGTFRSSTLTHVFAPLVSHFIFEADKSTDHNLVNEAISTVGVIASRLPWNAYYSMLRKYLKLIPRKSDLEKALVRMVISILDNFHFDIKNVDVTAEHAMELVRQATEVNKTNKEKATKKPKAKKEEEAEKDAETPEKDTEAPEQESSKGDEEGDVEMTEAKETTEQADEEEVEEEVQEEEEEEGRMEVEMSVEESDAVLAMRIHDTIVGKLLPELKSYLTNQDESSVMVRVPVALAITKLMKALPDVSLRTNLPGLLTSVCQILKSRQQEARDSTRETLVKITMFLGVEYFNFILKEMRSVLLRGYQLHVLGFTLHAMLTQLIPTLETGALDYCLKDIVDVLINDIFGETGVEKDTDEITGKIKEAKSSLSFHSFELLAGVIEFKNVGVIMVPLKEVLSESDAVKVTRKSDELLRRLAAGLNNNIRSDARETLIFCHGLIMQNLAISKTKEEIKKERTRMDINYTVETKRPTMAPINCFPANAHRFVAFGFHIFRSALNNNKFNVQSQEELAMLDPFVEIIGNGLFAKYPDVIQQSIRIMCVLAKLKLPSLDKGMPVAIKQTFALIKVQGNTKSELAQSCFRLLAVAIRECKKVVIKEDQLTMLLNLIQPDLEEPERQTTTFSLIRAIVSRKFVVPEMYDIMGNISQVMVTSQSQQAREESRRALLQFLLDYPQGRGRLRNQMNFLVKNLSYVFESGRQSVMEMVHVIIQKFADEVLMEYAELFFLALVMQLVNDDSSKCREMAGALIKELLQRMNRQRLDNSYLMLGKWFDQTEQRTLQRAASQVYGLAIEAFGPAFKKQIPELLPRLKLALESSLRIMDEAAAEASRFEDQDAMDMDAEWEVGYYALNTFTKLIKQFPTVLNSDEAMTLWPLIREHMLHPHSWVRLSSTRLFGVFFSGIDPRTRSPQDDKSESSLVLSPEMLRSVTQKLCEQLKSEFLSKDLGGQIVKNMFFIAKCFYSLPDDLEEEEDEEDEDGEEDEEEDEEDEEEEDKGEKVNGASTKEKGSAKAPVKKSLYWLLKRISFLSRGAALRHNSDKSAIQQTCIFQCMAAISTHIPPHEIKGYLIPIIAPIYRIVNDETAKGAEMEEVKKLGSEVLDLVQKRAGTTDYFQVYNKIRQQVQEVRRERRKKRVMQAMNDPEAHARRRVQKNEMKSRKRQQRNKEFAKDKVRLTTIKKRRVD